VLGAVHRQQGRGYCRGAGTGSLGFETDPVGYETNQFWKGVDRLIPAVSVEEAYLNSIWKLPDIETVN
jgi:hypothetical protein